MRLVNFSPDRNHLVAGRDLRHDPAMTKRVALYARCSTADRQTTENQIRDLRAVEEAIIRLRRIGERYSIDARADPLLDQIRLMFTIAMRKHQAAG